MFLRIINRFVGFRFSTRLVNFCYSIRIDKLSDEMSWPILRFGDVKSPLHYPIELKGFVKAELIRLKGKPQYKKSEM
jgi:hypothetical protein